MARGGITQPLVEDARNRLLARGENPSIDAIRAELGHTGSKTTISRHLKVIEARESTRLDDEALLGEHLKDLVGQLARQLRQDAQDTVDKAEQRHRAEADRLKASLKEETAVNERLREDSAALANEKTALQSEVERLKGALTDLQGDHRAQQQRIEDLTAQVKDKQIQVDSLEEKHRHAREALEHYRASVKEQRDQDQQRHDHQIQHLQAEQRQLRQTLAVKQEELTQATREATRLFTELTEARKQLDQTGKDLRQEQRDHRQTAEEKVHLEGEVSTLRQNEAATDELSGQVTEFKSQLVRLETELSVKNDLLARLSPNALGE